MNVIVKFCALILFYYWILTFRHFYFISGEKPRCVGNPLKPDEFSKKEDVGFVRDLCIDLLARNLFNLLGIFPSRLCEELANVRTSTCVSKLLCIKWKRSNFWNTGATNRVMAKAEALIEDFNQVVSKSQSLCFKDEKFIFGCIVAVERNIVDSTAATRHSKIIDGLRRLKNNFCIRYQLDQNQRAFQKRCGKDDDLTMERLDNLVRNEELAAAIKLFVQNFEMENEAEITEFYIISKISKTSLSILKSLPRLKFEFRKGEDAMFGTVFMKIPSLYRKMDEVLKKYIFDREVHFYNELLPALYQLGNCKPFAPRLYAVTKENAFVLEDLSIRGYEHGEQVMQLDKDQILIALDALAKYHALGYKYMQTLDKKDPKWPSIKSYKPETFEGSHKFTLSWFYKIVKPTLNKLLYEKILKMESDILVDNLTEIYPAEKSIFVIIHGDYRVNNILFKRDTESKVIEAMIIDWQRSRAANPVIDLIYFFITSVPIEIFEKHDNEFTNHYVNTFNNMLSAAESNPIYSQPQLNKDIRFYKFYCLKVLSVDWQHFTDSVLRGSETESELYKTSSIKWLNYFEGKGII